jgi:hypothetical protein
MAEERAVRVGLEIGSRWVFASALDWPGWCRRGKGEQAALDALFDYADRYAPVAGPGFAPGELEVVGQVPGNRITDFGAPDVQGPWDREPLPADEADRLTGLLEACWSYLDPVAAAAPEVLRKGPRGGGRDRDAIVDHVRGAERTLSCPKAGIRVRPRTPWDQQRAALAAALRAGAPGGTWPARYVIRRSAWHVLDHAWEIEDRAEGY